MILSDYPCVRRVAGLQAELFYVREGVINEYALNFVVPVPAHINDLHFTWQSLAGRPVSMVHLFS
jgi:RYK receptor-like tyrosine kinase